MDPISKRLGEEQDARYAALGTVLDALVVARNGAAIQLKSVDDPRAPRLGDGQLVRLYARIELADAIIALHEETLARNLRQVRQGE